MRYLVVLFSLLSSSALADNWQWQLENKTVFESVIAIKHVHSSIIRQKFLCDLTDALNEKTEMSSTIETVTPKSYSDAVLIVTCYKGANAEMIAIIEPMQDKVCAGDSDNQLVTVSQTWS